MNQDYIKKLIRILENSKIDSIQLSSFWGMKKIKLFRSPQGKSQITTNSPKPQNSLLNIETKIHQSDISTEEKDITSSSLGNNDPKEEETQNLTDSSLHEIKAPLVGTFYLSAKPGEPPFINVGDKIEPGKILCIIEAMKIFNEIESEVSGIVKEILIDDSSPVEYGQAIISVEIND